MIHRNDIIQAIEEGTRDNPHVHAFWLEGADAHDRVDEYADIDIWLDVDDEKIDEVFDEMTSILSGLSPLEVEDKYEHPHPQIVQKCYKLADAPDYLRVDVCIQKHSRDFWFRNGFADEKAKIIFDKSDIVRFKDMNTEEFERELRERIADLKKAYDFYHFRVTKNIHREHFLDAIVYYHKYIMHPLVEMLRIKHEPTKRDFYLKHAHVDLPKEVTEKLSDLYKINSLTALTQKLESADEWFAQLTQELDEQESIL